MKRAAVWAAVAALLLAACGGGGSGKKTAAGSTTTINLTTTVKPAGYPVPLHGPVGKVLEAQTRSPYRPAA